MSWLGMSWLAGWPDLRLRTKGLIVIAVPATATVMIACASYVLGTEAVRAEQSVQTSLRIQTEVQRLKTFEIEASAHVRLFHNRPGVLCRERARFHGRLRRYRAEIVRNVRRPS